MTPERAASGAGPEESIPAEAITDGSNNVADVSRRFHLNMSKGRALTEAVVDALRVAILEGVLLPSEWLREEELAVELGVSRTPVREALQRLVTEGLAVKHGNRGTAVAATTFEELLAFYVVRENLEALAAAIAAESRDVELLAELEATQRDMDEARAAGDLGRVEAISVRFHQVIRQSANNRYLDRFLTQVENAVSRFGQTIFDLPGRAEEVIAEHEAIVDAIRAGDSDAAARHAAAHMRASRDARVRIVQSRVRGQTFWNV